MIYSILVLSSFAVAAAQPGFMRGPPQDDHPGSRGPGPWYDDMFPMDLSNITCAEVEPVCTNPRGEEGKWVCRTLHHPVTTEAVSFSSCIDPERSVETDTCGCCNDECPEMCACACGSDDRGVLVQKDEWDLCVPPAQALRLITFDDTYTCVTDCQS
jgi:hypothetical protein